MSSEFHSSNIDSALIKGGCDGILNENGVKNGASKKPKDRSVRGIKSLLLQSPVLKRGRKLVNMV